MADNVILNQGAGGDTIAADDISGVKYQIVENAFGPDGTVEGKVQYVKGLPVVQQEVQNAFAGVGTIVTGGIQLTKDDASATKVQEAGWLRCVRFLSVSLASPGIVYIYDTNDADAATDVPSVGSQVRLLASSGIGSSVGTFAQVSQDLCGVKKFTKGMRAYTTDLAGTPTTGLTIGVFVSYFT